MFAFFLSSGLFLGWSLGANDAANVFGTAVGSRMIRFATAAVLCSIFVIIGSVVSGAGASETLGKLGSITAIAGAFVVAFAAAVSVYLMTKAGYPVSTSQAIVGAIIGWNLFSGSLTDYDSLTTIVATWVVCPFLSAIFAVSFYKLFVPVIKTCSVSMFRLDALTRYLLILAGIFGSYSLGANNIANVMGVFVPVAPLSDISLFGMVSLNAAQQLFFIGGVAIAVGVFTYSKRVMMTVGEGIFELSPVAALVVVWAHSMVLFLFASQGLKGLLVSHGLPSLPLVPVSSSQAIVGAVIGIGLLRGGRSIRWRLVGGIASGWVATPVIAAGVSFMLLFFVQNVFQQETYRPVTYRITAENVDRIGRAGMDTGYLAPLVGEEFSRAVDFRDALSRSKGEPVTAGETATVMHYTEVDELEITEEKIAELDTTWITAEQREAVEALTGRVFIHTWRFDEALARLSPQWRLSEHDRDFNRALTNKRQYMYRIFRRHDTASH